VVNDAWLDFHNCISTTSIMQIDAHTEKFVAGFA